MVLTKEILRQVIGLVSTCDVWKFLKKTFATSTMDRELTLHHQLETLRGESCDSLNDYLTKNKAICAELAALGKPLSDENWYFWMLNGLGPNY